MNVVVKWLILIAFVVLLITATAAYVDRKVNSSSDTMFIRMDKIREHIINGDWSDALDEFLLIEKYWHDEKGIWLLKINNNMLDEISVPMMRLKEFIKMEHRALALGELAALKQLVFNAVNGGKFNIQNVL